MEFTLDLLNIPMIGTLSTGYSILLIVIILWSAFWTVWALWEAAKRKSKVWFIILFVLNTVGILEILYIFVIGKKHLKAEIAEQKAETPATPPEKTE
jgi:methionyl-tRNA synthetase